MHKLADLLLRWRYAFSILIFLFCAWTLTDVDELGFATDYRIFFDNDDPMLMANEEIEAEFTKSYTLIYLVEALQGDLITPGHLQALQELAGASWRLPYVDRVNSLSNYQHTTAEGDNLWVEDLLDEPGDYDARQLQRVRDIVLNEPEIVGQLISEDARVSMVLMYINLPQNADADKRELVRLARQLAADTEAAYPSLKLRLSGQLAMDHAIAEVAERDSVNVESRMFMVLLLLLAVLLRSVTGTAASLAVMLGSVAATAGFLNKAYGDFNAINLSALYIVVMLAILDAVHVLAAYYSRLTEGLNKQQAMRASLEKNLEALFITTLTTSVGFLAMNFSESPPFREFGTATAFGVWVALGLTLTLLPAIVLLLPARPRRNPPVTGPVRWLQGLFPRFQHWYIPVSALVLVVMVPAATLNESNDQLLEYFYPEEPVREAAEFAERHLAGASFLQFSLRSERAGGVSEPEFLHATDDFVSWLEQQPEVLHVSSFSKVIKRLNRTMHGDDPQWYRIPDDPRASAEYMLVYESNVPIELDLLDAVSVDKRALRVTAYLRELSSLELLGFNDRANRWLAGEQRFTETLSSSPALMFAYVGEANIDSMFKGGILAALFICLSMMVAFRSVKLGLLGMIPNLMPAVIAFGLCGLVVGEINLGAAMVFSMTLGIVVDDTVHFVVSYRRLRREHNAEPFAAVHDSYALVGRAVIITSLVLCIGFMVPVLFAGLKANVLMYGLTIVCVAAALITDLFLLPAMLVRMDGKPLPARAAPEPKAAAVIESEEVA